MRANVSEDGGTSISVRDVREFISFEFFNDVCLLLHAKESAPFGYEVPIVSEDQLFPLAALHQTVYSVLQVSHSNVEIICFRLDICFHHGHLDKAAEEFLGAFLTPLLK